MVQNDETRQLHHSISYLLKKNLQNSRKIPLRSDHKYPIWCIMNLLGPYNVTIPLWYIVILHRASADERQPQYFSSNITCYVKHIRRKTKILYASTPLKLRTYFETIPSYNCWDSIKLSKELTDLISEKRKSFLVLGSHIECGWRKVEPSHLTQKWLSVCAFISSWIMRHAIISMQNLSNASKNLLAHFLK